MTVARLSLAQFAALHELDGCTQRADEHRRDDLHRSVISADARYSEYLEKPVRRTRRYAIAFAVNDDIGTVSEYQSTRREGRVPVYQWEGHNRFFVALRADERPPESFGSWQMIMDDSYGYRIMATQ